MHRVCWVARAAFVVLLAPGCGGGGSHGGPGGRGGGHMDGSASDRPLDTGAHVDAGRDAPIDAPAGVAGSGGGAGRGGASGSGGGAGRGGAPGTGGGHTDAGIDGLARVTGSTLPCDPSGWCWVHPLPTGNTLRAVLERAPNDVWAGGEYGTLLHWDGVAWTHYRLSGGQVRGLAAEPSGAIWAVGEAGLAARFDGTAFTITSTGTTVDLAAVATGSSGEVYAVGTGGTLLSWDGARWGAVTGLQLPIPDSAQTRPETRDLLSVWISAMGDVWVGGAGVLWRGQAGTWSTIAGATKTYQAIAGAPPSEVWVSTSAGSVQRWNGTTFTSVLSGSSQLTRGLWVGGASDVWVSLYNGVQHWDGTQWTSISLPYAVYALSGAATDDVWGVGDRGNIGRWNGRTWASAPAPTPGVTVPSQLPYGVGALWVSAANDIWLAGVVANLYHFDGTSITQVTARAGKQPITTFWGTAANNIWSFGQAGEITHWDGTSWTLAQNTGGNDFQDGRGSAANDIWAVTLSNAYHYDGTTWSTQNQGLGTSIYLQTVYAPAPGIAWGGALDGYLMRWDGTQWTQDKSVPLGSFASGITLIWGTATSNIFEFGSEATYHYDGQAWTVAPGAGGGRRAWGSGPNDLWVIAGSGAAHYDGHSWTGVNPDTFALYGIGGLGPGDAWLGTSHGLLRRQSSP
jgi:hypothetical protein